MAVPYIDLFNLAYSTSISESLKSEILESTNLPLFESEITIDKDIYESIYFLDELAYSNMSEGLINSIIDDVFEGCSEEYLEEVYEAYVRAKALMYISEGTAPIGLTGLRKEFNNVANEKPKKSLFKRIVGGAADKIKGAVDKVSRWANTPNEPSARAKEANQIRNDAIRDRKVKAIQGWIDKSAEKNKPQMTGEQIQKATNKSIERHKRKVALQGLRDNTNQGATKVEVNNNPDTDDSKRQKKIEYLKKFMSKEEPSMSKQDLLKSQSKSITRHRLKELSKKTHGEVQGTEPSSNISLEDKVAVKKSKDRHAKKLEKQRENDSFKSAREYAKAFDDSFKKYKLPKISTPTSTGSKEAITTATNKNEPKSEVASTGTNKPEVAETTTNTGAQGKKSQKRGSKKKNSEGNKVTSNKTSTDKPTGDNPAPTITGKPEAIDSATNKKDKEKVSDEEWKAYLEKQKSQEGSKKASVGSKDSSKAPVATIEAPAKPEKKENVQDKKDEEASTSTEEKTTTETSMPAPSTTGSSSAVDSITGKNDDSPKGKSGKGEKSEGINLVDQVKAAQAQRKGKSNSKVTVGDKDIDSKEPEVKSTEAPTQPVKKEEPKKVNDKGTSSNIPSNLSPEYKKQLEQLYSSRDRVTKELEDYEKFPDYKPSRTSLESARGRLADINNRIKSLLGYSSETDSKEEGPSEAALRRIERQNKKHGRG